MRGRRRRAKVISSPVRTRSRQIEQPAIQGRNRVGTKLVGQVVADTRLNVDRSSLDLGAFAARSSVRSIHEVVSKFDLQKRELVESTGFHGILEFPPMKQFDCKFVLWLMSRVNVESCTLTIDPEISISFSKADVGCVFGIPSSGRRILDDSVSTRKAKEVVLDRYLGSEFKEMRSIKIVQEIVERQYDSPMSKSDADIFRVAFVIFVASNLLSPSAKYDYASIDYWNAIQDPDEIISFDWSEYVVVRLLEAVSKLRQDVSSNIKVPNITGCSVFLQVWYLDSLDLGAESMPHNSMPRVRCFTIEKMRAMIDADSNYARFMRPEQDLPHVKLRDPVGCIYSWASEKDTHTEESASGCLLAIWESAVAMVHLLNIPLEAAGPVFVAAADFQNQVNSGLVVTGSQALKFMAVLVSIMIPYSRGFSYQSTNTSCNGDAVLGDAISKGISTMSRQIRSKRKAVYGNSIDERSQKHHGISNRGSFRSANDSEASSSNQSRSHLHHVRIGDDVQRSLKSVTCSMDSLPHHMNVNLRVATAMSQFYALIRKIKHPRGFDLNSYVPDQSTPTYCVTQIGDGCNLKLPSPWELGFCWPTKASDTRRIARMLQRGDGEDRLVIVHQNPKHIQVSLGAFRDQLMGKCEMELDLFDALIRCVRQGDDELYAVSGELRWRLFFESDFMEGILSGSFDIFDPKLGDHLCMVRKSYDISRCKLIFFPALLQFSWLCFVWETEENVIYVFDPCHVHPLPDTRLEAIERACYLLKLAMQSLTRGAFTGCANEVSLADMRLITLSDPSISRLNRSGVFCALFCRCYDGADLNLMPVEFDIPSIAAVLAHETTTLKDNTGTIDAILNCCSST